MHQLRDYTEQLQTRQSLLTLARIFQCLTLTKNDPYAAAELVQNRGNKKWSDKTQIEMVLRAAVSGQSATVDSSLIPINGLDLMNVIRPLSIVDRLPGVIRVPFDTAVTTTLAGTSSSWVGEGKPAPVSKMQFSRIGTLPRRKIATFAVVMKELILSASVDAQLTVSRDFIRACVVARDASFIDGSAAIAGVRPASIVSGAPAFAGTGVTVAAIDADLGRVVDQLIARGSTLEFAAWVMHPLSAAFLARLRTTNGEFAYEDITPLGGMLMGLPVLTSSSVPHVGSPQSSSIALIDGSRVWLASDDVVEIDTSEESTLEQLDNPSNDVMTPTPTTSTSMFETNAIALRGNQNLNFAVAESGAVAVLNELQF